MAKEKRNLIILGVGPNEFLIRAEGDEAAVREGMARLLPKSSYSIEPVSDKKAGQLESRLTDAQLKLATRFGNEAGIRGGRRLATYRLRLDRAQAGLVATATAAGALKFNPSIVEVRKPLGGGIGPVGVTVGVGIAGKF
jgi:hypothetical protein